MKLRFFPGVTLIYRSAALVRLSGMLVGVCEFGVREIFRGSVLECGVASAALGAGPRKAADAT